jgi:uncharacterized membrane protein
MLAAVPIGVLTCVPLLDLLGDTRTAQRLTVIGCLLVPPTALAGSADWLATDGAQRRAGLVHAMANGTAAMCYVLSMVPRSRGKRWRSLRLSLAGASFLAFGGWLGGHLAYGQGVGVDIAGFLRRRASVSD